MVKKIIIPVIIFVFFNCTCLFAQSVDEVLAKYNTSRGGVEKIKSIKTEITYGKQEMISRGMTFSVVMYKKRPDMVRLELRMDGEPMVQVYNGQKGWQVFPASFGGTGEAVELTGDALASLKAGSDIDGQFINYEEKGFEFEYLGEEKIGDEEFYKIQMKTLKGNNQYLYFSKSTGLLTESNDPEHDTSNKYSKYTKVGEIYYPFIMETQVYGTTIRRLTFDSVKVNQDVPDSIFEKPVVKK